GGFFFQADDGIRDDLVTGVQTCALPIYGTHVAATIAGTGAARVDRAEQGVAPGAALAGVKVLHADGSGTEAEVIAGVQWAVANEIGRASCRERGGRDGGPRYRHKHTTSK